MTQKWLEWCNFCKGIKINLQVVKTSGHEENKARRQQIVRG
ncbi:MAG: hypothetical protein ACR2NY_00845 [Alphaproteobacteria bacterium]